MRYPATPLPVAARPSRHNPGPGGNAAALRPVRHGPDARLRGAATPAAAGAGEGTAPDRARNAAFCAARRIAAGAVRWRPAPARVRLQRSRGGHGGSRCRDPRDQDQPRSNPSGRPVGVGTTSTGGAPWGAGETYTVQRNDPAFVSNNAAQEVAVSRQPPSSARRHVGRAPGQRRRLRRGGCRGRDRPCTSRQRQGRRAPSHR